MAFGKHWEWRGFGSPSAEVLRAVEALPLKFPEAQELTDRYLWVPGSNINVKLRFKDLKFKRRIESMGEVECWLEDESENHPFPIPPDVLEKLAGDLGIALPRRPFSAVDSKGLLDLLRSSKPPVRLVPVTKKRWQREWTSPDGFGDPEGVIVEAAEIRSPEKIFSIGLEHPLKEMVAVAREALGLTKGFRSLSYLAAVALWGSGGRIGEVS